MRAGGPVLPRGAAGHPAVGPVAYDRAELLRRLLGDAELVRQVLALFVSDAPGMVEPMRAALVARDWAGVARAAHSIKGVLLTVAAVESAVDAETLGEAVRRGDSAEIIRCAATLDDAVERLCAVLVAELATSPP